jgi:hypothetical protein
MLAACAVLLHRHDSATLTAKFPVASCTVLFPAFAKNALFATRQQTALLER